MIAIAAEAQIGAGTLTGRLADHAADAVPGVVVTAIETSTGRSRTTVTAGDGTFSFPSLASGTYRLRAELAGFKTGVRDGIRVATGEHVRIDLQLELGNLTETVMVRADAPLLRGETSALGHVVDNRKIVDLPLNGRSFIALASLAPGVAVPPPPAAPLPRINGGRPRTNEYLFDGVSVLQPEPGQVAFFPNVDAIQEFKIESNSPPAEFGRFNGGVVNRRPSQGATTIGGHCLVSFDTEPRMPATSSTAAVQSNRSSGAISLAASWAARSGATGPSSFSITRGSRRSGGRSFPRCRRPCSDRAFSPRRSAAACRSSTIRRRRFFCRAAERRGVPFGQLDPRGPH
jgi:hypothetical protein